MPLAPDSVLIQWPCQLLNQQRKLRVMETTLNLVLEPWRVRLGPVSDCSSVPGQVIQFSKSGFHPQSLPYHLWVMTTRALVFR